MDEYTEHLKIQDSLLKHAFDKVTEGAFEVTVKSGLSEIIRGPKMQIPEFIKQNYDLFVDFCDMDVNDEVTEKDRYDKAYIKAEEVMTKIYSYYVFDNPVFISCKLC